MKFKIIIFFLSIGMALQSCSPRVKGSLIGQDFPSLNSEEQIFVLDSEEQLPTGSEYVGDVKVGDTGFSRSCNYNQIIEEAKKFSKISRGNIVLLTEVKAPNIVSNCYRIKASMYRNVDKNVTASLQSNLELLNQSRLPKDADYAVVYFYRPKQLTGSAVGYKIRHNDKTVIGKVRNGEMFEFRTKDFGNHVFWAKTEKKKYLELNLEKGKEYFVRCGLTAGALVGRPDIFLIDNHIGMKEVASLYD